MNVKKKVGIAALILALLVILAAVVIVVFGQTGGLVSDKRGDVSDSPEVEVIVPAASDGDASEDEAEAVPPERDEPVPTGGNEPASTEPEEPEPDASSEPVPVVSEEPVPDLSEEPAPGESEEPVPDESEEPAPTEPVEPIPPEEIEPQPSESEHIHEYTDEMVGPTCEQAGYTLYTCECGDQKKEDEVPATGHVYESSVVASTCTEKGYTVYTCSLCGQSYKDNEQDASGHQYESKVVEPTAGSRGYTEHTCKVCKHSYQDSFVYSTGDPATVSYTSGTYTVPSGKVTADVITVNTSNPKVRVEVQLVDDAIGATDSFGNIVAGSDARVIVNANFFQAYREWKEPIGLLMVDGEIAYGESGLSSFGFTADGRVEAGRPSVVYVATSGSYSWTCFQCNMKDGPYSYGILYTPHYGTTVEFSNEGAAAAVSNGVFGECAPVAAGDVIEIPQDGYLLYFGSSFVSANYYRNPEKGAAVTITPEFFRGESGGFSLDGVEQIVSGAPRLVENGEICTTLEAGFQEERFTTSTTSRTAIGKLADGRLLLVSTNAAKIQQMRELMLQLGCVEAVNLDGGGSTALAYGGEILRSPGRQLTTTLHVFVSE